ncbi:MAG TPA: DNA-binding protein WhiA [Bacilli bacterium]
MVLQLLYMPQSVVVDMSFALDVKKEISAIDNNIDALKAELYGIVKLKANFIISNNAFQLEFITSTLFLARRIIFLFKKIYGINGEILQKKRDNLDFKNLYYIIIKDVKDILTDLDLIDEHLNFIDVSNKYYDDADSLLRGFFLAKGSVNDPKKTNYHLEIVCNLQEESEFIIKLLNKYHLEPKCVKRPKGYVVYLKKSEQIGDFLKIIGATNMMFTFENERIKKDLNNVVNRVLNCDIANSERTQASAAKQLADIKKIIEIKGINSLSNRLVEAIILRSTYPDLSLSELSEISEEVIGRHLSKSGINHCFRDLHEIAKTLDNK